MKKTLLLTITASLLLSSAGCITRDNTRYSADGKPWSRDKVTFFLVRGEASKVRELVKEKSAGDYEREVTIGAIKGESEADKLTDLVNAAYNAGKAAAIKSVVP